MWHRLLLSGLALVFGWFIFFAGCASIIQRAPDAEPPTFSHLFGLQIIFGASAYRSIKRRKLGIKKGAGVMEIPYLTLVCAPTIFFVINMLIIAFNDLRIIGISFNNFLMEEPTSIFFEVVIAPLWSLIGYIAIWKQLKREHENP